jgi:plasmid stabilization system protein ParE
MKTIDWSSEALEDYDKVTEFIATENPRAADLVADRLDSAIERLAEMPTGRRGRVEGTYEKSVRGTRLIIAYALVDDPTEEDGRLVILHIIHTARDWPAGQWPK